MVLYLYRNRDVFVSLRTLELQYIIYIFLAQLITVLLNAVVNQKAISILKHDISFRDAFFLQYVNALLNKIVSEGGALFRAVFLKEKYKLPYTKYLSTLAGLYIVSFLSSSIIGLLSLAYIYFVYGRLNYLILGFFLFLLTAMIVILFINPHFKNKKELRILRLINSVLDGWAELKKRKRNLLFFTAITVVGAFFMAIQSVFVYRALGQDLGIVESLYMASISFVTTFINITPDSVGIREGVYMFSSDIIGLDSDIILLGALIIRAIGLLNTFVVGGIAYLKLVPELKGKSYLKEAPEDI